MPTAEAFAWFLLCVAVASVVQSVTAFAFGLVLLAAVELWRIVPLQDATNACTVLALVNCLAFFSGDRQSLPWRPVRPIVWASMVGIVGGLALQVWLSANASQWLRVILGVSVVLSAANLLLGQKLLSQPSPAWVASMFGALSGVMGGLFSTSGPPIVYHMMRQPLDPGHIRRCLMLVFAVNCGVRLVLVLAIGQFSWLSFVLCCVALPVAVGVTRWSVRLLPLSSRRGTRALTGMVLLLAGLALVWSASARDFAQG